MGRLMALIILIIPGFIAGFGFKQMRDMLFGIHNSPFPSLWLQFIIGLVCFFAGLSFIAGFVLYRDRKKNKVQARFKININNEQKQ